MRTRFQKNYGGSTFILAASVGEKKSWYNPVKVRTKYDITREFLGLN